jgi:hypothetical protein
MKDSKSNNNFIAAIKQLPPSCPKLGGCSTCGGYPSFKKELDKMFPDYQVFNAGLQSLHGLDFSDLDEHAFGISRYLEFLSENERNQILAAWLKCAESDSKLAVDLLRWVSDKYLIVANEELSLLLDYAADEVAGNKKLRNELLGRVYPFEEGKSLLTCLGESYLITVPAKILAAKKQEEQQEQLVEEKRREAARQANKMRSDFLDSLDKLPFFEKVRALQFGMRVFNSDLQNRNHWQIGLDNDLLKLNETQIQQLIDWCYSQGFWKVILPKLHEKRHQLRLEKIDEIRAKLKSIPIEGWLRELLLDKSISIIHYPVELKDFATNKWFVTIEPELSQRFKYLLKKTNLKKWKKVEARLSCFLRF